MSRVTNEWPAWSTAKHFRRNQGYTLVTTGVVPLLTANPNRIGCIISAPNQDYGAQLSQSQFVHLADTSITGTKISYTVPAGVSASLRSAGQNVGGNVAVVSNVFLTRAGVTYTLAQLSSTSSSTVEMPLTAGDIVGISVSTVIPASVTDFWLGIIQTGSINRLMLSFNSTFATDQSINLYPGNRPLILWRDVVGDAITEDIYAHMATTQTTIGWWDFFY